MTNEIDKDKLIEIASRTKLIDIYVEMFKRGDFSFIVEGNAKNNECGVVIGEKAVHEKQKKALETLTSNKYDQFLYGGAAGGAKSWSGVCWIVFSALAYPGTRWFIARNELKDLTDSVMATFAKVRKEYGIKEFKYNAVKNYIDLPNGSHINLIEVKYKPSDPMYEDVGSTEYTGGWFEEIGEIHSQAIDTLQTRVGRHLNSEYGLKGTVFMTCNPKKNWAKDAFYDKNKKGILEEENKNPQNLKRFYLDCLVTENPFIEQEYIDNLRKQANNNRSMYERLFKGNWDYEDNPYQLTEQEMIEMVFDNNHVQGGKKYITADVARFGKDSSRIGVWYGWNLVEVISLDMSRTTEVELAILTLRRKHNITKNRCVVDQDGLGAGVVDGAGVVGFKNNGRPIKINGLKTPNYKNLQTQCLYMLADKINEGEIWISADLSTNEKQEIKDEFAQIQSKGDHDPERKLECKSKADIKQDIGRSPDWRDMIMMRVYFDLKPTRKDLVRRISR